MGVCVIIPTLNEEENIGKLIDSIHENAFGEIEIVVVDDGSSDKTVEIAKQKNAIVLVNNPGRCGPAFGWNRVGRTTKQEILCILGADFLIDDKNFFKKSIEAFAQDKTVAAIKTSYTTKQETLIEKIVTKKIGEGFEPRFIRKDVFIEINGFPEIGFGEDVVFVQKLEEYCKEKNMKFLFLKDVYFSGHGVQTLKALYKQGFWYGKTSLLFLSKVRESGLQKLKRAIFVYMRSIYLLSFVLLLLALLNMLFLIAGVPFLVIFLSRIMAAIREKSPYTALQTITYFVSGFALLHGVLVFVLGLDRKAGL